MNPNKEALQKTHKLVSGAFFLIANSKFDGIHGKEVGEVLTFLDDLASKVQAQIQEVLKSESAEKEVAAPQETEEQMIKRKWDAANAALADNGAIEL